MGDTSVGEEVQTTTPSSHEIPCRLRSSSSDNSVKWVSGVDASTTCHDILLTLLLPPPPSSSDRSKSSRRRERDVADYVLVEQWRGVERQLARSTKILRLWLSWGDEQCHVTFAVKRKRQRQRVGETDEEDVRVSSGQAAKCRPLRRRNSTSSSRAGDTPHPRRLFSSPQPQLVTSRDKTSGGRALKTTDEDANDRIEEMMQVIMSQGKLICDQLTRLGGGGGGEDVTSSQQQHLQFQRRQVASGHSPSRQYDTPRRRDISPAIRDLTSSMRKATVITPEQVSSASSSTPRRPDISRSRDNLSDPSHDVRLTREEEEAIESELKSLRVLSLELARLHALNEELHSAETKCHILGANLSAASGKPHPSSSSSSPGGDRETAEAQTVLALLREANGCAEEEMDRNRTALAALASRAKERREVLKRLEYDVNVVEKEGRKMGREYEKVLSIEIPTVDMVDEDYEGDGIYKELKELRMKCDRRREVEEEEVVVMQQQQPVIRPTVQGQGSSSSSRLLTTASPEGSTSGVSSGAESCGKTNDEEEEKHKKGYYSKEMFGERVKGGLVQQQQQGGPHEDDVTSDTSGLGSLHSSVEEEEEEDFGTLV